MEQTRVIWKLKFEWISELNAEQKITAKFWLFSLIEQCIGRKSSKTTPEWAENTKGEALFSLSWYCNTDIWPPMKKKNRD